MADLDFTAALDLGNADKSLQSFAGHVSDTGTAMENSGKQGGGMLGALGNIGSLATGVGVVAGGVGFLAGKLFDAAKAAGEDKASMDRLTNSLSNNAKDWTGNTDALDAYISKGQALAFSDDEVRDSLGLLVTQTGSLTDAQNLQSVAMDLARAKNISLEAASKLVMKADQGSEAALKKLGITISSTATKEEALAAIHAATAGAADTFATSSAGSMARLQSSMDDAVESIGGAILPQLTTALGGVADFVSSEAFQGGLQTFVGLLTDGIGGAVSFVSGVITPFIPMLQSLAAEFTAWATGAGPLPGVLGGLQGPITAVQTVISTLAGIIGPVAAGFGSGGLAGAVTALTTQFPMLAEPIAAVQSALTAIQTVVTSVTQGFSTGGLGGALAALSTQFPALTGPITAIQGVLVLVQDAANQVTTAFSSGGLGGVLDLVSGKIATANPLLQGLQGAVGVVTTAVNAGIVVWNVLSTKLGEIGSTIGPNLTSMFANMQPGIAAIQPIVEKLTPVLAAVGAVLGGVLVASISGLMGVLQGLSGALPGIGQVFTGTMEIINGVLTAFQAIFVGVTDTVKALISGDWQGALTALETMFTNLSTAGTQIFQGMMDQVGGIFSAAFGFIEGFATGFIDTFTGLIEGLAGSIGGTAKGVGDGIIKGMVDGLRNGKDAVINFIKGIAAGAVQAIKDFFGIASPSKVMADLFGNNGVMGGATVGIQNGKAGMLSALDGALNAAQTVAAQGAAGIGTALLAGRTGRKGEGLAAVTARAGGAVSSSGGLGSGSVNVYLEGRLVDPAYLSAELRTRQRGRGVAL